MSKLSHPMLAPKEFSPLIAASVPKQKAVTATDLQSTRMNKLGTIPLPGSKAVAVGKKHASAAHYQGNQATPAKFGGNRGCWPSGTIGNDNWDLFRARFEGKGAGKGSAKMTEAEDSSTTDFDGNIELCPHCRLPMGDFGYHGTDGQGAMIHGECMALQMLQELKQEEEKRQQKSEEEKDLRRLQYDLGWKVERIPRNIGLQQKLKGMLASHGLCCLLLQEDSKTVRLAPTVEPSAAVNLEYLSLALQVRRKEGREPLFSLDPVDRKRMEDADFDRDALQVKRFEPEWLAGTCVGEVLFQADYHLKELSMGECDQPVVGMKSCFELSEEEDSNKKWRAREWFMVRKAEVQLSEDNVLIPRVKMGVEAREQVDSPFGLQDAPITRQSHPMVKYADAFTKNFDLIAERKSVVYHLRELAKASVLAKFLVEAKVQVEESWFNLAGEVEEACVLEVPQLWNERVSSKIRVRDGEILGAAKGIGTNVHGVYGGVSLGLDKFDVSKIAPRRAVAVTTPARSTLLSGSPSVLERQYPSAVAPLSGVQLGRPALAPALSAAVPVFGAAGGLQTKVPMSTTLPAMRPSMPGLLPALPLHSGLRTGPGVGISTLAGPPAAGVATGVSITIGGADPRGVDLNLDQFSLEAPQEVKEGNWVCEPQSEGSYASMTEAFWSCVDAEKATILEDDLNMLKQVFNPNLTDRRTEGDCFAPPDTSPAYVNDLRSLLKEEEEIQRKRKDSFFNVKFSENSPGALFPSSWTSSLEIARPNAAKKPSHALQSRPDYESEAQEVLKSGAPAFQKKTEDGTTFRIYRVGTLEVRSTQAHDGEEVVGAIFAARDPADRISHRSATGQEKIFKVTEYVEKAQGTQDERCPDCRYYAVIETQHGSTIVTERLEDKVTWEEHVADLADRNSLAKVVRTASCRGSGVTVKDLQQHRAKALQQRAGGSTCHKSRTYATRIYTAAVGGVDAALKAAEKRQKEWDSNQEIDVDDEKMEKRAVEKVFPGGAMTLAPCSQCTQPFVTGYKSAGGLWFCSPCWRKECK